MAGLAYDVSQNLKLDLGYRYRHIDGGPMFAFDPATIAAGAVGTQGEDPGFTIARGPRRPALRTLVGDLFSIAFCSGGLRSAIFV